MSESKHTPGPWIVAGSLIQTTGTDRERKTIAEVRSADWGNNPNCNLLAAAPELLAALQECIYVIDNREPNDPPDRIIDNIEDITRAAIRKATGE